MAGSKLVVSVCALTFVLAGCDAGKRGAGVTPPKEELRDQKANPQTYQGPDLIKNAVKNLTFDKPNRSLFAAKSLGKEGANAVIAVPYLKEYIAMETNNDGFPSEAQRDAFKTALQQIEDDAKAKGVPIPTEKADLTLDAEKKAIEDMKKENPTPKK